MAYLIDLPTFRDARGNLTVVEKLLPFEIKRFYYIYDVTDKRGGHRHKKTIQALICLGGSCEIYLNDGTKEERVILETPNKCLIVEPKDWHTMDKFTQGSTLLVLSSEYYDRDDYIDEEYK
ncbi:MAG: FdtA/QdtA family cupin domain-containing protein [Epsilonproteobacteria bacterium]|nr:FdtA/QdtA family cupin domain-containing protein [Campylobacterota bacterium]MBD3839591.1 FdtA/QdtA family cupin domain-containing protein [Campylobacterota bacterium]